MKSRNAPGDTARHNDVMTTLDVPENEPARLEALRGYDILDTPPEASYDDLVRLAAHICGTPVAAVNFIDGERQWSKARVGLDEAELPRQVSFCARAVLEPHALTVVPDTRRDPRFADNPLAAGPTGLRFYAGAPVVTPAGEALGTLCVAAPETRGLSPAQADALAALARQAMSLLELRRALARLKVQQHELERTNALLAEQSATDALTGLKNRRAFAERLAAEAERSGRYGAPLSLLLLDVDDFKGYNDRFGHPAGDEVLRRVAALLLGATRRADLVARYGGEEFAVLLPDTVLEGALLLAERCRRAVAAADWPRRGVTVSVGVAVLSHGGTGGDGLVAAADQALYRAKRGGRDRVAAATASDARLSAPPG